ncbi:hypothetical protein sscle_04g036340 [Sclerotinia sclerotiorum 1980 UF-70]|uniref:Uncharacterized protein n=1 Tax=Sclerotinia sclerotiorum (strain ATCC 18683 / 1980 / Ss-1) TaxID=665079 RepID=A0A1D9Q1Q0_SCLS1|nr:hypothetical protein sscle_04g036340 [Sclerotinia sclerotiorum 1980 UF-70]
MHSRCLNFFETSHPKYRIAKSHRPKIITTLISVFLKPFKDLMPTISGPADAEMQSLDISDQRAALLFESAVNFSRRFFRSVCLEDPRKYIAVNHVCR